MEDNYSTIIKKINERKPMGKHLNAFDNQDLKKDYITEKLPNYLLIDKTGTISGHQCEVRS